MAMGQKEASVPLCSPGSEDRIRCQRLPSSLPSSRPNLPSHCPVLLLPTSPAPKRLTTKWQLNFMLMLSWQHCLGAEAQRQHFSLLGVASMLCGVELVSPPSGLPVQSQIACKNCSLRNLLCNLLSLPPSQTFSRCCISIAPLVVTNWRVLTSDHGL